MNTLIIFISIFKVTIAANLLDLDETNASEIKIYFCKFIYSNFFLFVYLFLFYAESQFRPSASRNTLNLVYTSLLIKENRHLIA
jgi:hypothetical protein